MCFADVLNKNNIPRDEEKHPPRLSHPEALSASGRPSRLSGWESECTGERSFLLQTPELLAGMTQGAEEAAGGGPAGATAHRSPHCGEKEAGRPRSRSGSHTDHSMDFGMHQGRLDPQGFDPRNGKWDTATCDTQPPHQGVMSLHPHSRSLTVVGWGGLLARKGIRGRGSDRGAPRCPLQTAHPSLELV